MVKELHGEVIKGKDMRCACGMPLGFYEAYEIEYMRDLGLPISCISCTHVRLEANERDRVELSV